MVFEVKKRLNKLNKTKINRAVNQYPCGLHGMHKIACSHGFDFKSPSHFACHFSGLANWGSQILACRAFGLSVRWISGENLAPKALFIPQ
jgi:hypothetical protein